MKYVLTNSFSEWALADPLCFKRLIPIIMLERLSTIDTCEAIAIIACTLLDVLTELAEMVVEDEEVDDVLGAELGLNAPGMARNAMLAFSKTAAWSING